jgi:hypothetical protein
MRRFARRLDIISKYFSLKKMFISKGFEQEYHFSNENECSIEDGLIIDRIWMIDM